MCHVFYEADTFIKTSLRWDTHPNQNVKQSTIKTLSESQRCLSTSNVLSSSLALVYVQVSSQMYNSFLPYNAAKLYFHFCAVLFG